MRARGTVAACVALALLASGCNPNDRAFFREGIGTELYTADVLPATDLQNIYLDQLCRQSMPFVGPDVPSCSQQELPPTAWSLIVQAGMNDIDARCDSYLAWLDQKKRENAAVLAEIGSIRFAVDALTNPAVATGISPVALAAVSAAFGLATNTLANINALLIQVDHTTVQSIVFINRRDFREGLLRLAVANKPAAVHSLRSYLEICMPMTISANINSTVTVFQQTGPGVLGKRPLVMPPSIGVPLRPVQTIVRPIRPPPDESNIDRDLALVVANFRPTVHTISKMRPVLAKLCITPDDVISDRAAVLVQIFQQTRGAPRSGKLTDPQIDFLDSASAPRCDSTRSLNYFESVNLPNGPSADLVAAMNLVLANGRKLPDGASIADIRSRIGEVRAAFASSLTFKSPQLANQFTKDLVNVLVFKRSFPDSPVPIQN